MSTAKTNTAEQLSLINNKQSDDILLTEKELKLKSFCDACIEFNVRGKDDMEKVAQDKEINLKYRRLKNILDDYKKHGAASLKRQKRDDAGGTKVFSSEVFRKIQDEYILSHYAKGAYENTHDWLRSISREFFDTETGEVFSIEDGKFVQKENGNIIMMMANKYCAGEYNINNFGEYERFPAKLKIGSLRQAQRYCQELKTEYKDALSVDYDGVENYRLQSQHTMKLNYAKLEPNELWCQDGKICDILVISEDWKFVARPIIYDVLDIATRKVNYTITFSMSAEALCEANVNAMLEWGIPKEILHDNGKDYRSQRFESLKKMVGAKTRNATVKLARAKPVEPFHNVIDYICKGLPGYTGNKYQNMPQATKDMLKRFTKMSNEFNKYEKLLLNNGPFMVNLNSNREGKIKSSKQRFLHINEFAELLQQGVDKYHNAVHSGLEKDSLGKKVNDRLSTDGLINKMGEYFNTPDGRYEYKKELGFTPVKAHPESLMLYALNYDIRSVSLSKGIQFNNEAYYDPKLRKYAGKKVIIKYKNINSKVLYIYYSDQIQSVQNKKQVTAEMLKSLKYVCLCNIDVMIDYNDPEFRNRLALQRAEEKHLKSQIHGNVIQMGGNENEIDQIREDEMTIMPKNPSKKKFKSYFDE